MNLADDFITSIEDIFSRVVATAIDCAKRDFLHARRAKTARRALGNAVNPTPSPG